MADKLLIILMNTELSQVELVAEAIDQARTAASMEYKVEVVFTGQAGQLAVQGHAEKLPLGRAGIRNIYQAIQDASQAGVIFKVCSSALGAGDIELIPEITETVGETYIISEAMDDETVTFTY
ncbi:MAG: hypothetical protein A2V90_08415 [Gammaproteobacteria bacterium RBG_16_57_12]|nr:MAG: hypothetical protein A2V90_08415 [Gammaproteobacteria bacterium RBG_16_57_12]